MPTRGPTRIKVMGFACSSLNGGSPARPPRGPITSTVMGSAQAGAEAMMVSAKLRIRPQARERGIALMRGPSSWNSRVLRRQGLEHRHAHGKLPCRGVDLDAELRVNDRIPLGSVLLALEGPLPPRARRRPPVSRRDFDLHDVPIAVDEAEGHPIAGRVDAIRRSDEAPLEGKPVLMRMVVATELGSAEQKGSGRAARSRKTRERVGVDPDHEGIDDFPVDILEVTPRLVGVAVDVEGDKEGAECPPLVAGVDPGPFTVAPIRQGCREATLLVPDVLASQAGDEDKGFSWVSLGDAEIVRAGT